MSEPSGQRRIDVLVDICSTQQLDLFSPIAHRIAARGRDPLTLVVLGRMSSGKSSLLNRLAGFAQDELLPVAAERVTARMTELLPGETQTLWRMDLAGDSHAVDLPTFRNLVRARGDEAVVKDTMRLRAELPALKAFGGLRLVDAPGFDSLTEEDEVWVRDYLPEADALIYCADSDAGLTAMDLTRLRELSGSDPAVGGFSRIHVLLTKADHFGSRTDAAAKLQEAAGHLQLLGMKADQVQLLSLSQEKAQGLEDLEQWIQNLRHTGAKAQRIRRQTDSLSARVKEEIERRLETLLDPAKLAQEEAHLETRRLELEAAIQRVESQAYQQSRRELPLAAAHYCDGLVDFYVRQQAHVQSLGDINQVRDFLVRFPAIREGDGALQAAWQKALGVLSEPFRHTDLLQLGLPEMDDLDRPLVSYIPGWLLTAIELAGDAVMAWMTFGSGNAAKEGARAPMWANKASKVAPKALKPMGKFFKWLLKKAPVLAPLLKSVRELASDHVKDALLASISARRSEAPHEAAELLSGLPEMFLEAAQVAGTLRMEQDAALREVIEAANQNAARRQTEIQNLRTALVQIEVEEN